MDATTAWEAYEQCKAIVAKLSVDDQHWVTQTLYAKYNALMDLEDDEPHCRLCGRENPA